MALLWSFAIGPALAILLARVLPLAEPYALGLILLGLAPCAPFVPLLAEKAGADLNDVAAYLLLASLGTLIILPIMIPILAPTLSADTWMIAKPLLFFVALPLAIGICVRLVASTLADKAHPIVKKATGVDIIQMLGIVMVLYWRAWSRRKLRDRCPGSVLLSPGCGRLCPWLRPLAREKECPCAGTLHP